MLSFKEEMVVTLVNEVRVRGAIKRAKPIQARLLKLKYADLFNERKSIEQSLLLAVDEGRATAASVIAVRQSCIKEAAGRLLTLR